MHPLSPCTELPSELWPGCTKYGHDLVAWYAAKLGRARLSDHGIENDPYKQALYKAAEYIFAIEQNVVLDLVNLDVERGEDKGNDLPYLGKLMDIKGTLWGGEHLIWPKYKNHLLPGKKFDALALVKMQEGLGRERSPPSGMTWGWMSKGEFQKKYQVAGPGHVLDPGTFYVHQRLLHDMRLFPGRRKPMFGTLSHG